MKVNLLITVLILLVVSTGYAQTEPWYKLPTEHGTVVVGAGPTYVGGTAKAGIFLKQNRVLGISAEFHNLLSTRKEVGIFGRQYLNSNRFSAYLQPGISYGTFESWNLNIDDFTEEQKYTTVKLNFSLGGEIRLSKMISLEGEAGIGKLIGVDHGWVPSVRSSLNIRFKNRK